MKKIIFVLALLLLISACKLIARADTTPTIKREHYMEIPDSILLKGIVQSEISTKTNNINDPVRVIIDSNFYFMEAVCIPENTIIDGKISEFQLPKKGRNGLLRIHFDSMTFPNGQIVPIDGDVWQNGKTIIGGNPSDLMEVRAVPFSANRMNYLLLKPTGVYSIGKHVTLSAGSEVLIKTNKAIKINFKTD